MFINQGFKCHKSKVAALNYASLKKKLNFVLISDPVFQNSTYNLHFIYIIIMIPEKKSSPHI